MSISIQGLITEELTSVKVGSPSYYNAFLAVKTDYCPYENDYVPCQCDRHRGVVRGLVTNTLFTEDGPYSEWADHWVDHGVAG